VGVVWAWFEHNSPKSYNSPLHNSPFSRSPVYIFFIGANKFGGNLTSIKIIYTVILPYSINNANIKQFLRFQRLIWIFQDMVSPVYYLLLLRLAVEISPWSYIVNVRAIMVKSCLEMFFPCLSNEMAIANVNIGPLWNRFLAFSELWHKLRFMITVNGTIYS
jgi:hypothetical protein